MYLDKTAVDNAAELKEIENFKEKGSKPKPKIEDENWKARTGDGELTLSDLKKRQREELNEQMEESQQKRFKIVNFTSEDSHVVGEKKLFSYYCSICGEHCISSEANCLTLPRRKTDKAAALDEAKHFHKKYANFGEKILLRRKSGVEKQYRFYCRQCRQPLGYRSNPPKETSKFTYFFDKALVSEQSKAIAFRK
mmetsp:Transcript_10148/g.22470  ORF Transcript_10148/g.22470 Transcript_10148/m.22470 type:complete len:195 (+) Transcript_10148:213-797(+)